MAPFKAFAGPSPNCCAVFVQMEHWAITSSEIKKKKQKRMYVNSLDFITAVFEVKLLTIAHSELG